MQGLLTINEAAEALRAPVATLRYWRQKGEGPPAFKVGKRLVYRERDVQAWVEERRRASRQYREAL